MSESGDLESASVSQRVVLAGVTELSVRDETPAHAGEIRRVCNAAMDAVEGDVVGTVSEAEVARTLNELDAEDVVDGTRDETSATGKGRPRYRLAVDADGAVDALADDDRVAPLADRIDDLRGL